jgi:CHAT domain-containing protein
MGSLEKGEGTISLARAFIYSGSASVISSLWNVREKSNRDIILNYYKEIKAGHKKDQALRDAKINYLQSIKLENQEKAHPFYWAPLVCIGDASPLTKINKSKPIIYLILSLILFVIVFRLFFYKN